MYNCIGDIRIIKVCYRQKLNETSGNRLLNPITNI